jgi:ApaG protein
MDGPAASMRALFPYSARTRGVIVRVSVSFMPDQSEPARDRWFWTYHIRIENDGPMAIQLLTRHWLITDGRGARHEVRGDGVIGEQPMIEPGQHYDYVSGCPLQTQSGSMEGSYRMTSEDGQSFNVAIPRFALIAPTVTH